MAILLESGSTLLLESGDLLLLEGEGNVIGGHATGANAQRGAARMGFTLVGSGSLVFAHRGTATAEDTVT